jgi:hypothetical protein
MISIFIEKDFLLLGSEEEEELTINHLREILICKL